MGLRPKQDFWAVVGCKNSSWKARFLGFELVGVRKQELFELLLLLVARMFQ